MVETVPSQSKTLFEMFFNTSLIWIILYLHFKNNSNEIFYDDSQIFVVNLSVIENRPPVTHRQKSIYNFIKPQNDVMIVRMKSVNQFYISDTQFL